jgi:hypothetical protein
MLKIYESNFNIIGYFIVPFTAFINKNLDFVLYFSPTQKSLELNND